MVLFDQNNFRLNKTGLHMVDTWSVHPNLTSLTSRVCLDVTVRALSREHGELLSDWLSARKKMRANELAKCVNLTEIMDFKQEIRDFSYGTSPGEKI